MRRGHGSRAVSVLKGKIAEALGPRSETSAIHVGISRVTVEGLPADPRFERLTRPYLSALRTRDGKLVLLLSSRTESRRHSESVSAAS